MVEVNVKVKVRVDEATCSHLLVCDYLSIHVLAVCTVTRILLL